ncbi:MAG: IS1 family transposase [Candidatus Korobacteraceae bacterium]
MVSNVKDGFVMDCGACGKPCQRFGKHRNGLRRFRCRQCKRTYTEPHQRTLGSMYVPTEKANLALQLLLEGNSIRSTERITQLDRNTIMRLLVLAGERCAALHDSRMRNIHAKYIQADEIWCYVGKKDKHVRVDDPEEFGNQWIFVGMDEQTKLVPSFVIGKRTKETTYRFLLDLEKRLADARFQLTTDGFHFYERGVEDVFGGTVDFAQLIKLFGDYGQFDTSDARYSPPRIAEVISKIRDGRPDPDHICTSHVERQNLTMRMQLRRLTRLTNAFSKKLANLKAAVALHFAYYNFCRIHSSIRVTPAMEAGITDHVWTLAELLS